MLCEGWELRDPVAGITAIAGGFRLARYELIHHGNLLWSPLKSFGVPLLSNDVQAAILYPLTLLFVCVPEMYFWNVFVCARIILIGMFTYMLAAHCMRLKPLAAWVFTLSFAYSLYVLRWMNHPWQNGLLAGLVYLYYVLKLLELSSQDRKKWAYATIGLLVGAYSLLTCGFPESAAMAAILISLVSIPIICCKWRKRSLSFPSFFLAFCLSHIFAFWLASPAVFALIEGVATTGAQYRKELGQFQYGLSMLNVQLLTRFTEKMPDLQDPNFFNLIPSFLFFSGFWRGKSRSSWNAFDVSAVLCMVFYLLKLFPIWPQFNQLVGSLPVLRQCWFVVYFMPIFLWGFSYFSARGAEQIFYEKNPKIKMGVLFSFFIVMFLFVIGVTSTENLAKSLVFKSGLLFVLFVLSAFYVIFKTPSDSKKTILFCVVGILSLLELVNTQPHIFRPFETEKYYFWEQARGKAIYDLLKENNVSPFDVREDSAAGSFTAHGIATIDNGNPPILPYRLRRLRQKLFDAGSDQEGYSPLVKQRVPYAWQTVGRNIFLLGATEFIALSKDNSKNLTSLGLADARFLLRDNAALDRAYVASSCIYSNGWEFSSDILSDSASFLPGKAILEELDEKEQSFCKNYVSVLKNIGIAEDKGTSLVLNAITGPALLVLSDTFYPGWKVKDKSTREEIKIHPANLAFRSVILPEVRQYELEFYYAPEWLFLSQIFVGLGVVGLFVLFLFAHYKTDFFRRS